MIPQNEEARPAGKQSAQDKPLLTKTFNHTSEIPSIAPRFSYDGFAFNLIKRDGDVALFAKRKPNHLFPSFEVVIIQKRPAERICGRDYPVRETMPTSETWGTYGWTYQTLDSAIVKFFSLVNRSSKSAVSPSGTLTGALSVPNHRERNP